MGRRLRSSVTACPALALVLLLSLGVTQPATADHCLLPRPSTRVPTKLQHDVILASTKTWHNRIFIHSFIGPIPWGHSGPLCHALSFLSSSSSWTSMRRRRATVATPGEWQCGVRRLAVANGPNIFQMLLVHSLFAHKTHKK